MRIDLRLTWQGTGDECDPSNDWDLTLQGSAFVKKKIMRFLKKLREKIYRDMVRNGIQSLEEGRL